MKWKASILLVLVFLLNYKISSEKLKKVFLKKSHSEALAQALREKKSQVNSGEECSEKNPGKIYFNIS